MTPAEQTQAALAVADLSLMTKQAEEGVPWWTILAGLAGAGGLGAAYGMGSDDHFSKMEHALQNKDAPLAPHETAATRYQDLMSRGAGTNATFGLPAGEAIAKLRRGENLPEFLGGGLGEFAAGQPSLAEINPADLAGIPENYRSKDRGGYLQDRAHYAQFRKGPAAAWWHQLMANGRGVPASDDAVMAVGLMPGMGVSYADLLEDRFRDFVRKETGTSWLEPHELNTKGLPIEEQSALMEKFYNSLPPALKAERQRVETDMWGDKYQKHTENYGGYMQGAADARKKVKQLGATGVGAGLGGMAGHYLHNAFDDDEEEDKGIDWSHLAATLGGAGLGGAAGYFGGTQDARKNTLKMLGNAA